MINIISINYVCYTTLQLYITFQFAKNKLLSYLIYSKHSDIISILSNKEVSNHENY